MGALPQVADQTYGYFPDLGGVEELVRTVRFDEVLVLGSRVPDVHDHAGAVRGVLVPAEPANPGLYWFCADDVRQLMIVTDTQLHPAPAQTMPAVEAEPDHPLAIWRAWFEEWWGGAKPQSAALYRVDDEVVLLPGREDAKVRRRHFTSGTWSYAVRVNGRSRDVMESSLEPLPEDDDPWEWIQAAPDSAEGLAATLTRAKLSGGLSDTVFSFRATRTTFYPYQFRPVLKFLQTGALRLLVADEVGLGKTIEAGLLWTELEARGHAGRVLIVSPSSLVAKWKEEMELRFGFRLDELDSAGLNDLADRLRDGKLPTRGAWICSLERMRKWERLDEVSRNNLEFDLVVVDEAHALRNSGTANNVLGGLLSDWADHLVFLSATPLNLHQGDLFNLLELLVPGEFEDKQTLDSRLRPNAALNRISQSLFDPNTSNADRRQWLGEIDGMSFAQAVVGRHEYSELKALLQLPSLTSTEIARTRRLVNELNALSAAVTRTRKVEVNERKAVRDARPVKVRWTTAEQDFYDEYLQWCVERAKIAGTPMAFSMQMPLRLAGSCLPAARDAVLNWKPGQDDAEGPTESSLLAPHHDLLRTARDLGDIDTKAEQLIPHIKDLVARKQRTLLFTFSKKTLAYLNRRLHGLARTAVLNGDTPKEKRREIMKAFREGEYDLVLANRVASEGLDFQFCSVVINYDLPWNPMEIEQRIGRIDRIGQKSDKIHILNFHTPGTIDSDIIERVTARIGVFSESIGELEPILISQIGDIFRDRLDFTLNAAERERRVEEALAAVEEVRYAKEELETAAPYLISGGGLDIEGFEDDVVRRGGYVGQLELALLVRDWARQFDESSVKVSADEKSLRIRGTQAMAGQLRDLVTAGERTYAEIQPLVASLQNGTELHLSLDQEWSLEGGPDLLTSTHPLVRAATRVPGYRQVRHASVAIEGGPGIPAGRYLVQLSIAEWQGVQPRTEVWTASCDLDTGRPAPEAVGDALLARLAGAGLSGGQSVPVNELANALAVTEHTLREKRSAEQEIRSRDNEALKAARRISIREVYARRRQIDEDRMATMKSRNRRASLISAAEAKITRNQFREEEALAKVESTGRGDLQLEPLAVVCVEVLEEKA